MEGQFITHSPEETEQVAMQLAAELRPGDLIAYTGGLGAGKTAFTRGLAAGLGLMDDVSSPTFALVNEYCEGPATLYHFDMYRVHSYDDLYSTGFFDYLENGGILAVEWSENIDFALPYPHYEVSISPVGENDREIRIRIRNSAQEVQP